MQQEIDWLLKEKYQGVKNEAFLQDISRLQDGEPLAYLIGHVPFLHTTIALNSRPLIPRPETEYWTTLAIDSLKAKALAKPQVLDMCAGSGCIGVAIGQALPHSHITFSELDPAHTKTIVQNCQDNDLTKNQYAIFSGDLFLPLPPSSQFDLIVTNPPYIDPSHDRTTQSVREYEPHHALYGGQDGLAIIIRILQDAAQYIRPAGQLWIEHEPEQVAALSKHTPRNLSFVRTHNDQYEVPRVSVWTMAI